MAVRLELAATREEERQEEGEKKGRKAKGEEINEREGNRGEERVFARLYIRRRSILGDSRLPDEERGMICNEVDRVLRAPPALENVYHLRA